MPATQSRAPEIRPQHPVEKEAWQHTGSDRAPLVKRREFTGRFSSADTPVSNSRGEEQIYKHRRLQYISEQTLGHWRNEKKK